MEGSGLLLTGLLRKARKLWEWQARLSLQTGEKSFAPAVIFRRLVFGLTWAPPTRLLLRVSSGGTDTPARTQGCSWRSFAWTLHTTCRPRLFTEKLSSDPHGGPRKPMYTWTV